MKRDLRKSGAGDSGFTLIELLIVIAIILILVAIALPNFIEAQLRAKVARVRGDQRSIAIATESYRIDNRYYMPYGRWGPHGSPRYFNALTTPIAYLTEADAVRDPFFDDEIDNRGFDRYGYYSDGEGEGSPRPNGAWLDIQRSMRNQFYPRAGSVKYIITSSGPDQDLDIDDGRGTVRFYTPTNGTKSRGDLLHLGPF